MMQAYEELQQITPLSHGKEAMYPRSCMFPFGFPVFSQSQSFGLVNTMLWDPKQE